jgi:hypothetical protein
MFHHALMHANKKLGDSSEVEGLAWDQVAVQHEA